MPYVPIAPGEHLQAPAATSAVRIKVVDVAGKHVQSSGRVDYQGKSTNFVVNNYGPNTQQTVRFGNNGATVYNTSNHPCQVEFF